MSEPILQPVEPDRRHLQPVPEHAAEPPRLRSTTALVALVAVICLLVSGTAVYVWQHGQIASRQAVITRLIEANRTAGQQVQALRQRAGSLNQEVGHLGARVERALAPAQRPRRVWLRMTGPPVADGTHAAYIHAAGIHPPRLVVDLARLRPGEHPRVANTSRLLRTIPVAPSAKVTLWSWHGYGMPQTVRFDRFAHVINRPNRWESPIVAGPFRITVTGGEISRVLQR